MSCSQIKTTSLDSGYKTKYNSPSYRYTVFPRWDMDVFQATLPVLCTLSGQAGSSSDGWISEDQSHLLTESGRFPTAPIFGGWGGSTCTTYKYPMELRWLPNYWTCLHFRSKASKRHSAIILSLLVPSQGAHHLWHSSGVSLRLWCSSLLGWTGWF